MQCFSLMISQQTVFLTMNLDYRTGFESHLHASTLKCPQRSCGYSSMYVCTYTESDDRICCRLAADIHGRARVSPRPPWYVQRCLEFGNKNSTRHLTPHSLCTRAVKFTTTSWRYGICLAGRGRHGEKATNERGASCHCWRLPASRRWFCTGTIRLPPKTTSPEADAPRACAVRGGGRPTGQVRSRRCACAAVFVRGDMCVLGLMAAEASVDSRSPNPTRPPLWRAHQPRSFLHRVRARVSGFPHICCVAHMHGFVGQICCTTAAASGWSFSWALRRLIG